MAVQCGSCGTDSTDELTLCKRCAGHLQTELRAVPDVFNDLIIAQTRQTRFARRGAGARSSTTPLVWDERASTMLRTLSVVIRARAQLVAGTFHRDPLAALPNDCRDFALWLADNIPAIRFMTDASETAEEIIATVRRARAVTDRPPDHVTYGVCGAARDVDGETRRCDAYLYAPPSKVSIECPKCHSVYDVEQRRKWMLEYVSGLMGTAPEIATYLRIAGVKLSSDAVRSLKRRGRITEASHTPSGRPLYRFSDVLAVIGSR